MHYSRNVMVKLWFSMLKYYFQMIQVKIKANMTTFHMKYPISNSGRLYRGKKGVMFQIS